jgi:glutathione synthase/RimK-type ligase-like ATP-grasp enzyme
MLILLWGVASEPPLAAVAAALERQAVLVFMLDQREVLDTTIDLCVGADVRGSIHVYGRRIDLAAVTAVYVRPYSASDLPFIQAAGPDSAAWRHAHAVDATLYSWLELTPALVVSRPSAMATNGSKPYQLEMIRDAGFCVPETLITTDPVAARAFWDRYGDVVYKSVSGIRSIVSRVRPEHAARLANISWCPTQFQRYIAGQEYRVHVVGDEVFACEVISNADDYRYPGDQSVLIRACNVPHEVADRCRRLAASLCLPVAGVDLRRDHEGRWYCFEVNPCPAFSYYERAAELPISDAIARLLAGASTPSKFAR